MFDILIVHGSCEGARLIISLGVRKPLITLMSRSTLPISMVNDMS